MNRIPATAYLPMTPVRAASCVLLLMFAFGLGEGDFTARVSHLELHLVAGLIVGYLAFMWVRSDSEGRGIARSRLLGVAMILVPLAAAPYYLLRSRDATERGRALGAYAGLLILMALAYSVGIGLHLAIRHAGT